MMGHQYQQAPAAAPAGALANINLQKQDPGQPWGFRLQGGKDFRMELSVKKITPGTPAHRQMDAGDAITHINGYETADMTHMQAQQLIKNSGSSLQLTVKKGIYRSIRPSGPVKFSAGKAYGYR